MEECGNLSNEYVAGFMDGEGAVTLTKVNRRHLKNPDYWVSVRVAQTSRNVLDCLQEQWGGSVRPVSRPNAPSHYRPAWVWEISGHKAEQLLRAIEPHVIVKSPQVAVALKFFDLGTAHTFRSQPEEGQSLSEERQRLKDELTKLNCHRPSCRDAA